MAADTQAAPDNMVADEGGDGVRRRDFVNVAAIIVKGRADDIPRKRAAKGPDSKYGLIPGEKLSLQFFWTGSCRSCIKYSLDRS